MLEDVKNVLTWSCDEHTVFWPLTNAASMTSHTKGSYSIQTPLDSQTDQVKDPVVVLFVFADRLFAGFPTSPTLSVIFTQQL